MDEQVERDKRIVIAWTEARYHLDLAEFAFKNHVQGVAILEILTAIRCFDNALRREGFKLPVATATTKIEEEETNSEPQAEEPETDKTVAEVSQENLSEDENILDRIAENNLQKPELET